MPATGSPLPPPPALIPSRDYIAEVVIDASPERVWQVLVDLPAYAEWNPFTIRVTSSLRVGHPVIMRVQMKPNFALTMREELAACDEGSLLAWGMTTVHPTVLTAMRHQVVEALPDGRTRYRTTDSMQGVLVPLVEGLFGADLRRGFSEMAATLKTRCEETQG